MDIFRPAASMTEDCSFAEEIENMVMQNNIPSSLPTPEDNVILKEELSDVYESLAKLPHRDINIFMMKYYDDCMISEISRKHIMTPSKIETLLQNTTMTVRKDLLHRGRF